MLTRRLHVLLDEATARRLEAEAARRSVAVAVLVREAIERSLPLDRDERRAALSALLAAEPGPTPADPADVARLARDDRHAGLG